MSQSTTHKDSLRYCGAPDCTGDDSCPWENVCMCGSPCDTHGFGDGHAPVSMHSYAIYQQLKQEDCEFP